jgi:hypothetical protein
MKSIYKSQEQNFIKIGHQVVPLVLADAQNRTYFFGEKLVAMAYVQDRQSYHSPSIRLFQ